MSPTSPSAEVSIGIDVGGTFTDLVAIDAHGRVATVKVLSTPADQAGGVMQALEALQAPARTVGRVAHGTTIATNTLLERTGARVTLCATAGATDLLELARQERASLYDLARHHPAPLVPHERCVAVAERAAPEGVVRPLTPESAREAATLASAHEPEAVAVALLHAYAHPAHERALASALRERLPTGDVVLSSDVLPEIREYERCATTVAEAYLRPRVAGYLARLAEAMHERGYPSPLVMTSSGGMRAAAEATRSAASLALSGPAGGVVGAAYVARAAGVSDALTIDIGGTSADAGVIIDGEPLTEPGGAVAGVPIALPRVLVETVSAGGGSIGWVDDGGALRVGPRSAGSLPGPAAFGRGGTDATLTDAHVALGNLRAGKLSGGITVDAGAAGAAVGRLARRLAASVDRTSAAMIAAADAAVARALRRVSVERGIDPRRCALVAFGGGGPLHACALAEHLGVPTVVVPPFAGVLSAFGLALAAERREVLESVMRIASELSAEAVATLCDALAQRVGPAEHRQWWVRARYRGQGHELDVPIAPGDTGGDVAQRFTALHAGRYGFALGQDVEVVSARHAAGGPPRSARLESDGARGATAPVRGPATVPLEDATMYVARDWRARPLAIGGWLLERER